MAQPAGDRRTLKLLIYLAKAELQRIDSFAAERGERRAVAMRRLINAALDTLGR